MKDYLWLLVLVFFVGLSSQARDALGESLGVMFSESRKTIADDTSRQGLDVVEREVTIGNLRIFYHQLVDPQKQDAPVVKGYGDYLLRCEFPLWHWNWDLEYFLDVTVTDATGKSVIANRARLQEAMLVLEQGNRAVVDMVWPLPGDDAGKLVVRLVKVGATDTWFYLEISLEEAKEWRLTQVRVGAYPFITTGPPERERWITSLARGHRMTNSLSPLEVNTEWGLVLHNRNAHESGGCLLVYDPNEVVSASAGGTYNVSVHLGIKPVASRSVHLALGYFWDQPWDQAVSSLRAEAEGKLRQLRSMPWEARIDSSMWTSKKRKLDELVQQNVLPAPLGEDWTSLRQQIDKCLAEDAGSSRHRAHQRAFLQLMKQVPELEDKLFAAAVQSLIETMK
jgi:hypothetical protein